MHRPNEENYNSLNNSHLQAGCLYHLILAHNRREEEYLNRYVLLIFSKLFYHNYNAHLSFEKYSHYTST